MEYLTTQAKNLLRCNFNTKTCLTLLSFAAILVSDYDLVLGFSCPEDIRRRLTSGFTHKSEKREGLKVTEKIGNPKKSDVYIYSSELLKIVSNSDSIRP